MCLSACMLQQMQAEQGVCDPPKAHVIGQDAPLALKLAQACYALKHEGNALTLMWSQPLGQHGIHRDRAALPVAGLPQDQGLPCIFFLLLLCALYIGIQANPELHCSCTPNLQHAMLDEFS